MPMHDLFLVLALSSFVAPDAGQQSLPDPIFALSQIGFAENCSPNSAFQRVVDMMTGDNDDFGVFQSVSGEMEHKLYLDEPADWHGLKLTGVHLYFGIERGPANYSLIFEDPPEDVRNIWNKRGWNLPAVDQSRDIEGLEGYAAIGVSRSGDSGHGARVTCSRD